MSELDGFAAEVIRMSDEDLQRTAEAIRGNPKNSTRRRFSEAESLALAAVMAEQARRVVVPVEKQPLERYDARTRVTA